MKRIQSSVLYLCLAMMAGGCAYMGFHGPSVKLFPDIHAGVVEDSECLACHHPDSGDAPPTPHPNFKGCLKCHQDNVSR